jgi:hypothetical protein
VKKISDKLFESKFYLSAVLGFVGFMFLLVSILNVGWHFILQRLILTGLNRHQKQPVKTLVDMMPLGFVTKKEKNILLSGDPIINWTTLLPQTLHKYVPLFEAAHQAHVAKWRLALLFYF